MTADGDWRDPYFGDDDAARAREQRRAEREARRRERQAAIGDRVREAQAPPPEAPDPPAETELGGEEESSPDAPIPAETAVDDDRRPQRQAQPGGGGADVPSTQPVAAPLRGGQPPGSVVHRRRLAALIGLAAVAFVVFVVVVAANRLGGEEEAPVGPVKERKTISLTIPEGYSRDQIAAVAKKAGLEGDYMKASQSVKGFDANRYGAADVESLEGFLFPATYEVFKNATVDDLVGKQLEAFEQNMDGVDLSYAKSKNLNAYDVLKIASMIEREVQVEDERDDVAAVIYNRLAAGMPLGIDATIRYEDSNYDEQLLESRLAEDTPYNTRTNTGLPPGPIGNPGLASIEAAAKPAQNDYLFFVIKPGTCGEHVFTETEDEFFAAEAEYQAALEAEGGSPTEC